MRERKKECRMSHVLALSPVPVSAASQSASLPAEHLTTRVCTPPPHLTEHADHASVAQLGHTWVLHACEVVNTGHARPLWAAGTTTVRVAVWRPPPHVLEHLENDDQADTTQ